jgi:hypothetical protein
VLDERIGDLAEIKMILRLSPNSQFAGHRLEHRQIETEREDWRPHF